MKSNQKGFIVPILIIIMALAVGGIYVYKNKNVVVDKNTTLNTSTTTNSQINNSIQTNASETDALTIQSPQPNELVKFPISIKGFIQKGNWGIFEGEAGGVQVFDANGKSISNIEPLKVIDYKLPLKYPINFEAVVGDREMMGYIQTTTGIVRFSSAGAKDGDEIKTINVKVRFK